MEASTIRPTTVPSTRSSAIPAHASASLGIGSLDYIVAVFVSKYYTNYTGLDAAWAGTFVIGPR